MQKESKIWNELKEISPLIAEIDWGSVLLSVPSEYFNELPDRILSRIKSLETESPENELNQISSLIGSLDKSEVYQVPERYFIGLPEQLIVRIKADEALNAAEELEILSPVLSNLDKAIPYGAPVGYFNDLPESLTGGIKAIEFVNDELENLSPVMISLKNQNPYRVPENYFENLSEHIIRQIKTQPAKVVSLFARKPFLRYAAAAALTGILITIGVFTFNKHSVSNIDPLALLSKASDQDIVNFIANQDILLNEKANKGLASLEITDNDVKDLFGEIPDAELQQYVNERSSGKDLITN
ncbi:MAG: hypothetical protein ACHQEM_01830 [Chitinophagales bacterium]